ncbi:hypothetical protein [Kibdelosporangium phytohabitans]|uniref:Uncharacterized protein n=1 Tax=Kibdelosporangium phytohabitans TaxID=860235 RepID=A0A0N9I7U3_9PSEU|nr:hypothetical protein [Kibdelosporangium phytohabitans]ALG14307.1 hypothetical protein AOZ06_52175 [Kibdelosporangium phytohabitans]MBE1466682.1 hypothetical protein [Kibdelosporangium phytohabitans]
MIEDVVSVVAEAERIESFDPLVDLYGVWTTDLAERYLPIEGAPPAKSVWSRSRRRFGCGGWPTATTT